MKLCIKCNRILFWQKIKSVIRKGLEKNEGAGGEEKNLIKRRVERQKVFSFPPPAKKSFTPAVKLGDFLLPDGIVDGFEDDGYVIEAGIFHHAFKSFVAERTVTD